MPLQFKTNFLVEYMNVLLNGLLKFFDFNNSKQN